MDIINHMLKTGKMKKIIFSLLSIIAIGVITSCEIDDIVKISSNPVVPSMMTPANNQTYVLDRENADEVAATFTWSVADYGFEASITYTLQIALEGDNFTNVATLASVDNGIEASIIVSELNKKMIELSAELDSPNNVEIRVLADVNPEVEPLMSEPITIVVTPYATTFPPIYMIGGAVKGWDPSLAVEMKSSAPNEYKTTAYFTSGEAFRFFAQPDWNPTSYNFTYFANGSVDPMFENAADDDSNFRFISTSGWYEITVNLKTYLVSMTAVSEPIMYMTGSGIGGWDTPGTGASIKMTFVKTNVWEASATFVPGEAFRFFAQADWNPTSYNYPYFADGSVDSMFEEATDDDKNFKFIGTAGTYIITLDLDELTVTMETP